MLRDSASMSGEGFESAVAAASGWGFGSGVGWRRGAEVGAGGTGDEGTVTGSTSAATDFVAFVADVAFDWRGLEAGFVKRAPVRPFGRSMSGALAICLAYAPVTSGI